MKIPKIPKINDVVIFKERHLFTTNAVPEEFWVEPGQMAIVVDRLVNHGSISFGDEIRDLQMVLAVYNETQIPCRYYLFAFNHTLHGYKLDIADPTSSKILFEEK